MNSLDDLKCSGVYKPTSLENNNRESHRKSHRDKISIVHGQFQMAKASSPCPTSRARPRVTKIFRGSIISTYIIDADTTYIPSFKKAMCFLL